MDISSILKKHAAWLGGDNESGERANLVGANLRGANLSDANLSGADLRRANLRGADLRRANLRGADLREANLRGANLRGANLRKAYLRGADLRGANLSGANLRGADLEDAYLCDANLSGADLVGANIEGADLVGCAGNLTNVKSIVCERYSVNYTVDVMQVGCERHPISDWWEFDDKRILEMDDRDALNWWRRWKPILQQIIAMSPATATGYQGEES